MMGGAYKATAIIAERVWHFEVREEADGQWRAFGYFMGAHLERLGASADRVEKSWRDGAQRIAADIDPRP